MPPGIEADRLDEWLDSLGETELERVVNAAMERWQKILFTPFEGTPVRVCAICGELLRSRRHDARLCSARCRQRASRARRLAAEV